MSNNDYKNILKEAIGNEIEAYEFYNQASGKSVNPNLKAIFAELAQEELKHKVLLESFLQNDTMAMNFQNLPDYKVSESVELPRLTPAMSFADGVALAMKKEEEAMNMYTRFANASSSPEHKNTFIQLAKMEQGHKIKLENLYSGTAYNEVW